jgi:hypothetical protein
MKRLTHPFHARLFLPTFACAVVACLIQAPFHPASAIADLQESHVEHRYVKSSNLTVVTSDSLYVINMPTQFMQVRLTGRYPDQGPPTQMPDKITLQFDSYATDPLYPKDESHRLAVRADAEVLDFGLMSYVALREDGKDTYTAGQKSVLGVRSPIPPDALVRTANKGKALTLESMSVTDVPLSQITKLARASQVLMKIGDTVFALTATQLSILREFVTSITPAGGLGTATEAAPKASTPNIPPDVPSNANNASLDLTLKWLKKELPRSGAKGGIGARGKIEVVDFNSCKIKYRIVPLIRTSAVSSSLVYTIIEYQFNLADINPETVRAADLKDFSTLIFSTFNEEQKIKVISRANASGMAGRTLEETLKAGAILYLRDANSATQIKEAFVHAIELCRPHP